MDPLVLYGQIFWTGLAFSTYNVLFAVAFALVLKVTQLWNFTQAGVMAVAFYSMFWALNSAALHTIPAVGIGLLTTFALSAGLEKFGFEVLRKRNSPGLTFFIFTLIFSEFVAYLMSLFFGTEPQTLYPSIMSPVIIINNIVISHWDLKAFLVTFLWMGGLYAILRWSRLGQTMVAVSDNAELAEFYGISKNRAYLLSLIIAAGLITTGMYLYGTRAAVHPNTTLELLIFSVMATILGGIGNIFGAALAAVVLALLHGFSILIIASRWQGSLLYLFLFLTILFLPQGFRLPRRRDASLKRLEQDAEDATGPAGAANITGTGNKD